ncbi:hypothetical protein AB5J62_15695 [Amycolatopsis sp. cg5]|uniref:hypothetical protein n=1 Tax=Amycolatopsis sp. cg5 TaxID=3238802 RepID=UPI0035243D90
MLQRAGGQLSPASSPGRKRLYAGLVLLGVVVAGVLTGLLLIGPREPEPAPSAPPPPRPAPTSTLTSPSLVESELVATGQAIAAAITQADSAAFGKLACEPQSPAALKQLQDKWDTAGTVTATMVQPVKVAGERATITIHVESGNGGKKDTDFPIRKKADRWCIPG